MKKHFRLAAASLLSLASAVRADDQPPSPPPILMPEVPKDAKPSDFGIRMVQFKDARGRNMLVWWGRIAAGDSVRFQAAMGMVKPIEIIFLASVGGDMDEGMAIARIIHNAKISTHILKDSVCISACNFIFLGGIVRVIDDGGQFITHMFALEDAPRAILLDMYEALRLAKAAEKPEGGTAPPPPEPPKSPPESPDKPALSSLIPRDLMPLQDTVGKLPPPSNLKSLGCDADRIFSEGYEHNVKMAEARLEGQKITEPDILAGKKDPDIKDPGQLAMLRALTMDYVCSEQNTARAASDIALFVIEMRLSLKFLRRMTDISNAQPKPLTRQELIDYNVINSQ